MDLDSLLGARISILQDLMRRGQISRWRSFISRMETSRQRESRNPPTNHRSMVEFSEKIRMFKPSQLLSLAMDKTNKKVPFLTRTFMFRRRLRTERKSSKQTQMVWVQFLQVSILTMMATKRPLQSLRKKLTDMATEKSERYKSDTYNILESTSCML